MNQLWFRVGAIPERIASSVFIGPFTLPGFCHITGQYLQIHHLIYCISFGDIQHNYNFNVMTLHLCHKRWLDVKDVMLKAFCAPDSNQQDQSPQTRGYCILTFAIRFYHISHMTQIQTRLLEVMSQPGFRKCFTLRLKPNRLVHFYENCWIFFLPAVKSEDWYQFPHTLITYKFSVIEFLQAKRRKEHWGVYIDIPVITPKARHMCNPDTTSYSKGSVVFWQVRTTKMVGKGYDTKGKNI